MQPDIPWNVAGISADAREAARAAARREGLSVGEWLTRRILRSFADGETGFTAGGWTPPPEAPMAPSAPRENDEMLARLSRAESDANQISRRIEQQLLNVARRLDSTERSQSENNRAMSKAAAEINVAAREQAQAFDQLGSHVVGLSERLRKLERNAQNEPLKDAVKVLHQGLSRLTDQISQTTQQSAGQISALAANLDAVVSRIGETRSEAEHTAHLLEEKFAQLAERLNGVERIAETSANTLERTLDSIEARQAATKEDEAEYQRRSATTASSLARLEDTVARLESANGPDPALDRRLQSIEHTLGSIASRIEEDGGVDERIRMLSDRIEQTEKHYQESLAELRSSLASPNLAAAAQSGLGIAATPPAMHLGPNPAFAAGLNPAMNPALGNPAMGSPAAAFGHPADAGQFGTPPFPGQDMYDAPPPFPESDYNTMHFQSAEGFNQMGHQPQGNMMGGAAAAFDAPPGFVPDQPFGAAEAFNLDPFANQPAASDESYLAAMRRSARAATTTDTASHKTIGGFTWGTSAQKEPKQGGQTRYLLLIVIALIAATAVLAGVFLSQRLVTPGKSDSALFSKDMPTPAAKDNAILAPEHPAAQTTTPLVPPLEQKEVRDAPIKAIPGSPRIETPAPASSGKAITSLDKLTQLANSGNAKAEMVVGLKYLDGDGVPANEAEAAKWLTRAAEKGEPMAQYRLGTLYERGKGVGADPAKAVRWYQAAAQQGNRKAMHNLAVAYAEGAGVQKNFAEAARWFSKAATMGLADSQFNLAVLYERGLGVPQSLIDAFKWYAIAASQGDAESKNRIGALATQLSPDDKAAAQRAASGFKPAPLNPRSNVAPTMEDLPAR